MCACAQVDSARKLRWFDQDDLSQLVEVTTREKQALQDTIAALRQVCCGPCCTPRSDLRERPLTCLTGGSCLVL
jgi:hypothetical protein